MGASLLSLDEIMATTGGSLCSSGSAFQFFSVATDSRNVCDGSLFVPLIGEKQDGHVYIPQALEKGACSVLIARKNYSNNKAFFDELINKNPSVAFISVDDTLHACYVGKFPGLIKIAVTGSSGKTTTKEIALALLSQKYKVIANEGNLNSETGLPLSVFNIRKGHEVGLFEMGMNRRDEMKEIAAVLKPRHAVVTNIGTAHIGILGSREAIAEEKAHVFDYLDSSSVAFIPKDDDFASFLSERVSGHSASVCFYGEDCVDGVQFVRDRGLSGTDFTIEGKAASLTLPGRYNYRNALAAICLARELGLSTDQIIDGFARLKPMFGRCELIRDDRSGIRILQDCYNANPDSMEKAIGLLSSEETGSRFMVLGDMLELGEASLDAHRKVIAQAAATGSCVLLVGHEMAAALDSMRAADSRYDEILCFSDSSDSSIEKIADWLKGRMRPGGAVLVKGSRGMALERLADILTGGGRNG